MHVPLTIPARAKENLRGWKATPAYGHLDEVATWRLTHRRGGGRFLKVARIGREPSLAAERDRMVWASTRLPVPKVLQYGVDEACEWLLTAALKGVDATDAGLQADPAHLVASLAEGLRRFHDADADNCPFDNRLEAAFKDVQRRVASGLVDPARDFHPEHRHLSAEAALVELRRLRPKSEDVVLCHGDYCLPNVLLKDGRVSGYVDLGEMGVADRWHDLAVATWSVTWNLGPGREDPFLDAYGIDPDPGRVAFYRLLYDLAS